MTHLELVRHVLADNVNILIDQIEDILGIDTTDACSISAKTGEGITELFEIVENLQDVTLKEGNFLILTHTSDIDILSENHRDIIITGSAANKIEFINII